MEILEFEKRIKEEIEDLKDGLVINVKSENYLEGLFILVQIHKLEWVLWILKQG